jgi:sec-independent protein translocase protein TatB
VFGVSFSELLLVAVVALVIVGPARLPGMLNTLGKWSVKARRMMFDMRAQSGIDEILREEGLLGGLQELRQLRQSVRSEIANLGRAVAQGPQVVPTTGTAVTSTTPELTPGLAPTAASTSASGFTSGASFADNSGSLLHVEAPLRDPYQNVPYDRSREYPVEGCDASGALPDDLWESTQHVEVAAAPAPEAELLAAPENQPLAPEAEPPVQVTGDAETETVNLIQPDAARVE